MTRLRIYLDTHKTSLIIWNYKVVGLVIVKKQFLFDAIRISSYLDTKYIIRPLSISVASYYCTCIHRACGTVSFSYRTYVRGTGVAGDVIYYILYFALLHPLFTTAAIDNIDLIYEYGVTWPQGYGEEHFVILSGGLHIEMATFKVAGNWLCGSG